MTDSAESDDTGLTPRPDAIPEDETSAPDTSGGASVETTVVTMVFDASEPARILDALARYVVVARGHPGCRNIDLCASETVERRYVVISKWASPADQRRHFDSEELVELARACEGRLTRAPRIDLLAGLSAHDLA